jgi:hypothetical protein
VSTKAIYLHINRVVVRSKVAARALAERYPIPLFVVLIVVALSWPVSLWVAVAFVSYLMFRGIGETLEADRLSGKTGLLRASFEAAAKALSETVIYVGLGVFLVAIVQATLRIIGRLVDPSQLRRAEEALSSTHELLSSYLDLRTLAIGLAVAWLVTLAIPRSEIVRHFVTLRSAAARVSLVLLGVTSFTFFGALELLRLDREWRQAERARARSQGPMGRSETQKPGRYGRASLRSRCLRLGREAEVTKLGGV